MEMEAASNHLIRSFLYRNKFKLENVNSNFNNIFTHKDEDGKPSLPRIVIEILGAPDSGKTVLVSRVCEKAYNAYGTQVAFWNMPEILEEELKRQDVNYFYRVNNLNQVKPESILNFDEGAIDLNAKLALTKKSRGFGEWLNIIRHKHCMVVINSQVPLGIIADARRRYTILVCKKLHTGIDLDPIELPLIIRQNEYYLQTLRTLKKSEALIVSTHEILGLEDSIGLVKDIKLPSWWTPQISEMWANRQIDQREQNISLVKAIADEAINLGYAANNKVEKARLLCWLFENYELPSELVSHILNKVLASSYFLSSSSKPVIVTSDNEKYTDEGFEANVLQTLPEFIGLWSTAKNELLAQLENVFNEYSNVTKGDNYIIPPRQTLEGDPSNYPDAVGILKDGNIGLVNAKFWAWRNADRVYTHKKMKSEILWYTRLLDKGFPEPKVILFAKHKVTQQTFIFYVPVEKAKQGSYPILLPNIQPSSTLPNLPSQEHKEEEEEDEPRSPRSPGSPRNHSTH